MKISDSNKIYKSSKDDIKISWALMSSFIILALQYLFLVYFKLLETSMGSHMQLLSKGLVGTVYLYALPAVLRRSKKILFLSYVVAIFIFMLHYAFFPENRIFMMTLIIPFFFMVLPSFVYALSLKNLLIFEDIMGKTSYIVFYVGIILGTLVFFTKTSIGSYSMPLAYYMLLPTILFLNKLLSKFTFRDFIIFILSLAIILSLGSRGPILCIVVFFLLRIFRPNFRTSHKKAISFFSVLGIGTVILIFFKKIIEFVYNLLLSCGIYSRTLYLFSIDRGLYLSGRSAIYQIVIDETIKNLFFGIGLAGDKRVTSGDYVHNIFLEIIANFGLIAGVVLIFVMIYMILKAFLSKNNVKYTMATIWISIGFIPLLVSGSYLISINFAIFIGIVININRHKSHNIVNQTNL